MMTYDQTKQEAVFDKYARAAVDELVSGLLNDADLLIRIGRQRAFQLGLEQYGDSTFHLGELELETEIAHELGDAVFYAAVLLANKAGDLRRPD